MQTPVTRQHAVAGDAFYGRLVEADERDIVLIEHLVVPLLK